MAKELDAVILSACRTPIGSFGGALKDVSAVQLGAIVIREALARAGDPDNVSDVILGCVLQAGAGMNVARQAALAAGLPQEVTAETINRVCGSGLQAVIHAVEAIGVGYTDLAVIDVTAEGLVLREIAVDTTVEQVRAATGAHLILAPEVGRFG